MGFNYFGYGNIHPCKIDGSNVIYKLPSGFEVKHPTGLDINIPEQVNPFISETVAFLLYHEGKEYVGRSDGTISIYRQSDNLLVGLNYWTQPKYPETTLCGYYYGESGVTEIHVDNRDRRSVYVVGESREAVAKEMITVAANTNLAFTDTLFFNKLQDYFVYNGRGDSVELDVWSVQENVRCGNCPIFL